MKIGIIGDVHWSKYSSIVRTRGKKYSERLENCIKSINWAEKITQGCDKIIYVGDFFDSSELNSEELTALKELVWNDSPHIFLVGNHELGLNDLSFSSAHLFDFRGGRVTIDKPCCTCFGNTEICYLPYIVNNSGNIEDYLTKPSDNYKRIIFSHNDIAGIQLGKYVSQSGFSIENIEANCDLFINGHLHNGNIIGDKIINIGNLTGQNFNENAFNYSHHIGILDTDTLTYELYDNPYAFNFYKLDTTVTPVDLTKLKSNSVLTIKVSEENYDHYKTQVTNCDNIITSRFIIVSSNSNEVNNNQELISVNHLDKFKSYVIDVLGSTDLVLEELEEVLK